MVFHFIKPIFNPLAKVAFSLCCEIFARGFVDLSVPFHIGNGFCSLNCAVGVMRRGIYGINFEQAVSGVYNIVPCACKPISPPTGIFIKVSCKC